MRRIRRHLTFANVASAIALFVALTGGTAIALGGANTVFTDDIANDTQPPSAGNPAGGLTAPDLRAASVGGSEVANNSLTGADVNEAGLDATPLRTRVAQGGCEPAVAGTGVMVKVGSFCIDKYEASVWDAPTGGTQLTTEAQIDAACPNNGQGGCANFYARSVPGVEPASQITWFQAQQALANSAKQLPTNAEWQAAVSGTPDSTACNVSTGVVANTGANAGCVSRFGAFDMVGNLYEWVAEWMPRSAACGAWSFSGDDQCFAGAATTGEPGALIRGGDFHGGTFAGPFAVSGNNQPSFSADLFGFRGAR